MIVVWWCSYFVFCIECVVVIFECFKLDFLKYLNCVVKFDEVFVFLDGFFEGFLVGV